MDIARLETDVRSEMLADFMVNGIAQSVGRIRKRPHLSAGFTELKAQISRLCWLNRDSCRINRI